MMAFTFLVFLEFFRVVCNIKFVYIFIYVIFGRFRFGRKFYKEVLVVCGVFSSVIVF